MPNSWTSQHLEILKKHRQAYNNAEFGDLRDRVVQIIKDDLRGSTGRTGLPKSLKKASGVPNFCEVLCENASLKEIEKWYRSQNRQNGDHGEEHTDQDDSDEMVLPAMKWKRKWNKRRVVEQMEKAEIKKVIGGVSGSSHFMGAYTNAVTQVMNNLDPETRKKYTNLAESWNNSCPPPDVQQRFLYNLYLFQSYLSFLFTARQKNTSPTLS